MAEENAPLSKIFRSYDIRGVFPSDINEDVAEAIGAAYARLLSGQDVKQVVVSHDVRISSPKIALALIKGFASVSPARIGFAGMLPIGAAMFHAHKTGSELAYITASHLPPEWNGMKIFRPTGLGLTESEIRTIGNDVVTALGRHSAAKSAEAAEHLSTQSGGKLSAQKHEAAAKRGLPQHVVIDPDAVAANYKNYLVSKIRPKKRMRVVIDCGNGATSNVAPKLFAMAGFDVKALWAQPDGRFPNRSPDPYGDSLSRLKEAVKSERAYLGLAFDGDGDRVSVIDEQGSVLTPEQIAHIILSELLKTAKGPVIANVECTRLIDDVAKRFGSSVIRIPVGHTNLIENVHKHKAVFGAEVSGHYAMPALSPFDDSLAIIYYGACVLASQEKPLSAIVSEIPSYPFERINFVCEDERKFEVIKNIEGKLRQKYKNVNTMDGVRVDLEDGWALVRASNTEPKIRLTIEANDKERFEQLKSEFTDMLHKETKKVYTPSFAASLLGIFRRKK